MFVIAGIMIAIRVTSRGVLVIISVVGMGLVVVSVAGRDDECRSPHDAEYDADDDVQRTFSLYIDRNAKIVSAFIRNPHPNTITQLQETNL